MLNEGLSISARKSVIWALAPCTIELDDLPL